MENKTNIENNIPFLMEMLPYIERKVMERKKCVAEFINEYWVYLPDTIKDMILIKLHNEQDADVKLGKAKVDAFERLRLKTEAEGNVDIEKIANEIINFRQLMEELDESDVLKFLIMSDDRYACALMKKKGLAPLAEIITEHALFYYKMDLDRANESKNIVPKRNEHFKVQYQDDKNENKMYWNLNSKECYCNIPGYKQSVSFQKKDTVFFDMLIELGFTQQEIGNLYRKDGRFRFAFGESEGKYDLKVAKEKLNKLFDIFLQSKLNGKKLVDCRPSYRQLYEATDILCELVLCPDENTRGIIEHKVDTIFPIITKSTIDMYEYDCQFAKAITESIIEEDKKRKEIINGLMYDLTLINEDDTAKVVLSEFLYRMWQDNIVYMKCFIHEYCERVYKGGISKEYGGFYRTIIESVKQDLGY